MKDDPQKPGSTRALVALLAFVLGFATVPHRVCERDAARWFAGDPVRVDALAEGVERWTTAELGASSSISRLRLEGNGAPPPVPRSFATGGARGGGEWLFATYMMAAMGFGQVALERHAVRAENIARMERCLDAMLTPALRTSDARAWSFDALDSVAEVAGSAHDRGHVAYLGYTALALALHRTLAPASRFTAREEAIASALVRRIDASETGLIETYPGEVYPVDNASALAAIALHRRATGSAAPAALERGLAAMRAHGVDPETGLLFQAVAPDTAAPRDAARASGTALAVYFLGFADGSLSRTLFHALERRQVRTVLGFGGMMEYPPGRKPGKADIDSGPVVLGFGVSASGFSLGASRIHGDIDTFRALSATAHLFGAPLDEDHTRTYATGGPIGDAILFAMLTAPRLGTFG